MEIEATPDAWEQRRLLRSCAILRSRFERIFKLRRQKLEKLMALRGETSSAHSVGPEQVLGRLESLLDRNDTLEEAEDYIKGQVEWIEREVISVESELQGAFGAAHSEIARYRESRNRIEALVNGKLVELHALGSDLLSEEERNTLENRFREGLKSLGWPQDPIEENDFTGWKEKSERADALSKLEGELARLWSELADGVARDDSNVAEPGLELGKAKAESIESFLKEHPVERVKRESAHDWEKQIGELFSNIAARGGESVLDELMHEADKIGREDDSTRARMLYENLVMEASAKLRDLKALRKFEERLGELCDSMEHLRGRRSVEELVNEIETLTQLKRPTSLEELEVRIQETIEKEEAAQERERKRYAILESILALGYEPREGLKTGLVEGGKLIVRKADEEEYGVEIVLNDDLSKIQTAMVRFAESAEMTRQQRLRDVERETEWCEDHADFLGNLEERGFEPSFLMKLEPGAHPVKVVVEGEEGKQKRREDEVLRNRQLQE